MKTREVKEGLRRGKDCRAMATKDGQRERENNIKQGNREKEWWKKSRKEWEGYRDCSPVTGFLPPPIPIPPPILTPTPYLSPPLTHLSFLTEGRR